MVTRGVAASRSEVDQVSWRCEETSRACPLGFICHHQPAHGIVFLASLPLSWLFSLVSHVSVSHSLSSLLPRLQSCA